MHELQARKTIKLIVLTSVLNNDFIVVFIRLVSFYIKCGIIFNFFLERLNNCGRKSDNNRSAAKNVGEKIFF